MQRPRLPHVPRYDVPKAAPEPLRLVQRFVNTIDMEHEREWLATPADLDRWLDEAGIAREDSATERDVARARELREALRALLATNNSRRPPPADAVTTVNRAARSARLALELGDDGRIVLRATGHAKGVDACLAKIVAVAFEAMLDGGFGRLKACRNCRWAFYDYSRNRVASWCSMSLCGNRLKTRRYRARRSGRA